MVGGEDGKTRGHAAHWERRRAGADRGRGFGGREGERVRENQREEEQGRKARWRLREKVRVGKIQRKKREVTGRGRMNFRVSFYRKLQRDNSSLVPINVMVLMIPTKRHKSRVELNKSEGAADSNEGGRLLSLVSTRT